MYRKGWSLLNCEAPVCQSRGTWKRCKVHGNMSCLVPPHVDTKQLYSGDPHLFPPLPDTSSYPLPLSLPLHCLLIVLHLLSILILSSRSPLFYILSPYPLLSSGIFPSPSTHGFSYLLPSKMCFSEKAWRSQTGPPGPMRDLVVLFH